MNRDHYVAGQRPDWRGPVERRRNSVREPNENSNVVCFVAGVILTSVAWLAVLVGVH